MSGARFVRFYPSDWRSGCIGLSLEQEGFYIRVCAFIYETGRRLPASISEAARLIGTNANAYKKLHAQLVALGKLSHHADGWSVARAEKELQAATRADQEGKTRGQTDQGRNGTRQDTLVDAPQDAPLDTPPVHAEIRVENQACLKEPVANSLINESAVSARGCATLGVDLEKLSPRLFEAANGAIANPAAFPGLLSMATPMMWLESGADLERDVLPTLKAIGKAKHGKGIRSWDYFNGPIADARAKRERGMPTGAANGTASTANGKKTLRQVLQEREVMA